MIPDSESRDERDEQLLQAVRERAHEIWQSEGSLDGFHFEHWIRAEREVLARGRSGS
jgi:hypothetical protein